MCYLTGFDRTQAQEVADAAIAKSTIWCRGRLLFDCGVDCGVDFGSGGSEVAGFSWDVIMLVAEYGERPSRTTALVPCATSIRRLL